MAILGVANKYFCDPSIILGVASVTPCDLPIMLLQSCLFIDLWMVNIDYRHLEFVTDVIFSVYEVINILNNLPTFYKHLNFFRQFMKKRL